MQGDVKAQDDFIKTKQASIVNIPILHNDQGTLEKETVQIITHAAHGNTRILMNGDVQYTPGNAFIGIDTFQYKICTDLAMITCSKALVTIKVVIAPSDDKVVVEENVSTEVDVLANDQSRDYMHDFTLEIISPPVNGNAEVVPTVGKIAYTPKSNFIGADIFTYKGT